MRALLSESELVGYGERLGAALSSGEVLWLEGDLGAGKTTLVKAVVQGLGADQGATSPTYGLVHRYGGRRGPIYHVGCHPLASRDAGPALDW